MAKSPHVVYEFGQFRLDRGQKVLVRNGELIPVAPKVLDTLLLLVQNRGRILEKEELLQSLWPESFVEEGNLSQNIFVLRKLLGGDRNGHSFIQTVPRRGYRFVAAVEEVEITTPAPEVPATDYWLKNSPFRGLRVFEPEDAWLFFGREPETNDLLERMKNAPVLAIIGNSGCGKSSLVRAGLIPALMEGRFSYQGTLVKSWRIAIFRPSAAPFDYLAEVLPKQLNPDLDLKSQAEFIADCRSKLPMGGDTLRNSVSALVNSGSEKPGETHVLLVADQFEEIFTLTTDPQLRQRYIDELLAAARLDSAVPVHLILVLRADFYANCLDHAALSKSLETNLYNIPRMPTGQLRASIERRLDLAASPAEEGLISSLIEDVGAEPGNLALLEHALGQLWEKAEGMPRKLTNRAYAAMGRLRGALGRHADEIYDSIGNEEKKRLTQKVFLELVQLGEGAQDTRRRVSKADLDSLGSSETVDSLLARLISSRLLSAGREGNETFIEVSHEALIREWPALREWIAQNREELVLERRLFQAASEWESLQQDAGALLRGARLAQAEEWMARHPEAPALLRQFLSASAENNAASQARELAQQKEMRNAAEAKAQAEKLLREQQATAALTAHRSARRLRQFSWALGVLLLIAIGSAWIVYRQELRALSQSFSARSTTLLARDHGQALNLALQSWQKAKTEEARLAMARAFPQLLETMNQEGAVTGIAFSPDGSRLISAGADHTARLWNVADGRQIALLQGHSDAVTSANFSPDGKQIVTASFDHTARVWNADDGRLLLILNGHTDKVAEAKFSPDGKLIVTASDDHTARIWSSHDGRPLFVLHGHSDKLYGASFSPDGLHVVTAGQDLTARVWSTTDGHLETTLQGHKEWVFHAEFFPDNQRILTTSWDQTARIWSRSNGSQLAILQHNGPVNLARISPDGARVVTVSDDHTARIWDSADGHLLFTLRHEGPVHDAQFSPNGRYVITAGWDRTARIWSINTGHLLALIEGHTDVVDHVAFSPDSRSVATAGADHTVRIWSTNSGLLVSSLGNDSGPVAHAEISSDGERIVTVSKDQKAQLWQCSNGKLLGALQNTGGFRQAHFSPDGARIITAGVDGTAQIWDGSNGRLLLTLKEDHPEKLEQAAYSPDGKRIVTAGWDTNARVWDSADGRLLATLRGHSRTIWYAVFSPDGQKIVTASDDNTARVWNVSTGNVLFILQGHLAPVWRASFSPDGHQIATASFDHTARLWDSADGHLIAALTGHLDILDTADFSPDGKTLLTSSWDYTARLWRSVDGQLLAVLQGHTDKVISAAFSPDGRQIVTAGRDHTARVWSATDYGLVAVLSGHADQVWQAMFAPNGHLIVTASLDETARTWRVFSLDDMEALEK